MHSIHGPPSTTAHELENHIGMFTNTGLIGGGTESIDAGTLVITSTLLAA